MKKLLLMIPFLVIACQKKEAVVENSSKKDSIIPSEIEPVKDSSTNGVVAINQEKPKEISDTFRVIEGNEIIKTINGDMIPLEISDEFSNDQQKFVIKIKNFKGSKISGVITTPNSKLNIRFNQVRMADGEYDGPFGREINYDIKDKGEIWLIIGKNLMADGDLTGKFTVSLK